MKKRIIAISILSVLILSVCVLGIKTQHDLRPVPGTLSSLLSDISKIQVFDRHGSPLTITYQNRWNTYAYLSLHDIPEFIQQSFIIAEDKRFFKHGGVDWTARFHALWQNITAARSIRGASTITEQIVRLIHPRPRTFWSRWLEGIEAGHLEKQSTKSDILEFYLNQVPYAQNRKGISQAARYYFNRDITTLTHKEMMALAVLVRAPSYLDLYKNPDTILPSIERLAGKFKSYGLLTGEEYLQIISEDFQLAKPVLPVHAGHFVNYVLSEISKDYIRGTDKLYTTIDSNIQSTVQDILDRHVENLKGKNVVNGAVLVVDHTNDEMLAWVNRGKGDLKVAGSMIDAVTTLRQPGSALKPFLYAMALEKGWTPATLLNDSPFTEPVGHGLHSYQNYSRTFYGPISLREALGNSLNIPAIHTIQYVGVDDYLSRLCLLGFNNLVRHPDYYGDGLALGNGEVTLLEMVQAYTVLAKRGIFVPLKAYPDQFISNPSKQIYSEQVASLIANILSDPTARLLEFGNSSVLNLPVQTAVKTGTSSDYRDAWAMGFNYHYTVGVWMGNLDGSSMDGISGAKGPAMVLRSIFAELNRFEETRPLYLSPALVKKEICDPAIQALDNDCQIKSEWFIAGTEPQKDKNQQLNEAVKLVSPTEGLQLAMDPRIPDTQEAFEFHIAGVNASDLVEWKIDNNVYEKTLGGKYIWPLKKGPHTMSAIVWNGKDKIYETGNITFLVK